VKRSARTSPTRPNHVPACRRRTALLLTADPYRAPRRDTSGRLRGVDRSERNGSCKSYAGRGREGTDGREATGELESREGPRDRDRAGISDPIGPWLSALGSWPLCLGPPHFAIVPRVATRVTREGQGGVAGAVRRRGRRGDTRARRPRWCGRRGGGGPRHR